MLPLGEGWVPGGQPVELAGGTAFLNSFLATARSLCWIQDNPEDQRMGNAINPCQVENLLNLWQENWEGNSKLIPLHWRMYKKKRKILKGFSCMEMPMRLSLKGMLWGKESDELGERWSPAHFVININTST